MDNMKFRSNWLTVANSSKLRCVRCSHKVSTKDMEKHESECQSKTINPISDIQFQLWTKFVEKAKKFVGKR